MPDCWCEAVRYGSLFRQPLNVFTNAVILLVALYILLISRNDTNRLFSRLYALGCLITGLGSMFFHASLSHIGQWTDMVGMYFIACFLILYNFSRLKDWSNRVFLQIFVATVTIFSGLVYVLPEANDILFFVVVLSLVFSTVYAQRKLKPEIKTRYLVAAIVAYYTGSAFWILDQRETFCEPASWFQGHAIWHALSGLATVWVYAYFRSEKNSRLIA